MKQCIIIGGGVSVKEGISLGLWNKIKGKEIWSINYAFLTMPYPPNKECWVDISFFKNNIDRLQLLCLSGVPCHTKAHPKYATIKEIYCHPTSRDPLDIGKIFIGRMGLSGFFTLSLAVKEGFDEIYLLGYDFGSVTDDNKTHYYQGEINVISSGVGKPNLYRTGTQPKDEIKDFEVFLKYPIKIINVSPKSKIDYFEKIDYNEFFKRIGEQ